MFALLHDFGEPLVRQRKLRVAIAGAKVWELVEAGWVRPLRRRPWCGDDRIRVEPAAVTGRNIDDLALWVVNDRGHRGTSPVIAQLAPRVREVFSDDVKSYDVSKLRARLLHLLTSDAQPETPQDAAVISMIWAAGGLARVFPEVPRRSLRRRSAELRAGNWVAAAARRRIRRDFFRGTAEVIDIPFSLMSLFP